MSRKKLRMGLLVAGFMALLGGTAQANTVTIGSPLSGDAWTLEPFGPSATVTNYALPGPATAASPVDGTVINWRFIGDGGPLTPRVLRSTGTTSLAAAGTGTPQNATGTNVISGPFSVFLPIKKGDYFGVDGASGAGLSIRATAGATSLYFTPALADGAGEQAPYGVNDGYEDAIGATVRFCLVPKLKGQTGKAAKQALRAADCTVGKVTKSKKRRKKKSVLSQTVKPGSSISDTVPVDLTISGKKK